MKSLRDTEEGWEEMEGGREQKESIWRKKEN